MTVAYRVVCEGGHFQMNPVGELEFYKSPDPICRQCGQTSDHFFTSQRDQTSLCATCFGGRETQGLAKEVQKSRHPLDAWMEG